MLGLLVWRLLSPHAPTVQQQGHERCLDCHTTPHDLPNAPHAEMGCAICHLGEVLAATKAEAHRGLEREPGALATVGQTCARSGCHADEGRTVATSLMATGRGLIAVDRWAFGEIALPNGATTVVELLASPTPTAADDHLRKLCAGCHLNSRRANRDDAISGRHATGSGCSACHIPAGASVDHAVIDAHVADDRCVGCHSRSARIGLSYQGLAEAATATACAEPVRLPDGRAACAVKPDAHHAAGLACIDCHVHTELMGDGVARNHEAEQVEVTCASCHGPGRRTSTWGQVTDAVTLRLSPVRAAAHLAQEPVLLASRGTPLWNVRQQASGAWVLRGKLDGKDHAIAPTPVDAAHRLIGHARLTCASCHAAWTPTCASCHTDFAAPETQWDFAAGAVRPGRWRETSGGPAHAPPVLAVRDDGQIAPAAPGMILELDATARGGGVVKARWFSAFDPHTTAREARTCVSCHQSPVALGLGQGRLLDAPEGPQFAPDHVDATGFAADRWTTLTALEPAQGTRVGLRSLNTEELRRVVRVGACLRCHEAGESRIFADFAASRQSIRRSPSPCAGAQHAWPSAD